MIDFSALKYRLTKSGGLTFLLLLFGLLLFAGCSSETEDGQENQGTPTEHTTIMYFPWSGSDIYTAFLSNISDVKAAMEKHKDLLGGQRLVVFLSQSEKRAVLFELYLKKGKCEADTLKRYTTTAESLTSTSGMHTILSGAMSSCKANTYSLIIGSHGTGWLPKALEMPYREPLETPHRQNTQRTRAFGSGDEARLRADVEDLAKAISLTGQKLTYILFDDCFMANVETAYALRRVTDVFIASSTEMMFKGMPYRTMLPHLLRSDYRAACQSFLTFYNSYSTPCGTIAAVRTQELEHLALVVQMIGLRNTFYPNQLRDLQYFDACSPHLFYDLGSYVEALDRDQQMTQEWQNALQRAVIAKAATATYYTAFNGREGRISAFSGLTTSAPVTNAPFSEAYQKTAWYKATN